MLISIIKLSILVVATGFSAELFMHSVSMSISQVQVNTSVSAYVYNTTNAYYKCTFTQDSCSMTILFPEGNAAVLTSPIPRKVRPIFLALMLYGVSLRELFPTNIKLSTDSFFFSHNYMLFRVRNLI